MTGTLILSLLGLMTVFGFFRSADETAPRDAEYISVQAFALGCILHCLSCQKNLSGNLFLLIEGIGTAICLPILRALGERLGFNFKSFHRYFVFS